MSKKNKPSINYLDCIPVRNENHDWEQDDEGNVTILIENKGAFNRLAQKFFKKPKVTQVHLQGMGNYIWTVIDGKKSIYELGACVKEKFGDEAEPLYERLSEYMRILDSYGFIKLNKKD